ncbi:MAG: RNA polymerase sigma factor, partial [Flavobacteriales bacterium]|nr:RNA polymerase sigma factor [Flavobacteriales bacterium]
TERSQQELIDGCLKGDSRSQHAIYKMYYGKMKAVCLRYASSTDEAKDMVQDGFIKVFSSMEKFEGSGSLEGWIRRIMVNLSIDQYRKKKHHVDLDLENSKHFVEESADEEDEQESDIYDFQPHHIVEAMQQLTPVYRTVFNLYVFENFSHQEISEKLGISLGTSKSNYAKAKKNMKKILLKNKINSANEQ